MADEDEKAVQNSLPLSEEEALRLKTLAEQNYTSKNLISALRYAKRAHKLHPSLDGLPELFAALKVVFAAATPIFPAAPASNSAAPSPPDYYKILDVERFSHINTIKKQYKKLALILHPDKSPGMASEEAFKLVGEAVRVLSDNIRRKEYDMRLRIAMQTEEVAVAGGVGEAESFWAACSACRLLHQFERKYLGHNLICPSCKKSFKAVEVEENLENEGNVGGDEEEGEAVGAGQTRVSARTQVKVAKDGKMGTLEKYGVGSKRKTRSLGDGLEKSGMKIARNMGEGDVLVKDLRLKTVENPGRSDNGGIKVYQSRRLRKAMNMDTSGHPGSSNGDLVNGFMLKRFGGKEDDGIEEDKIGGIEIVASERAKRAKGREEETMTLAQMQMLVKKRKLKGKLVVEEKAVNQNLTPKKKKEDKVQAKEKENEEGKKKRGKEKEKGESKASKNVKEKGNRERKTEYTANLEIERHATSEEGALGRVLVEKEKTKDKNNESEKKKQKEEEKENEKKNEEINMEEEKKEKETETVNVKEKSDLFRVSEGGNSEVKNRISENRLNVEIESDLEILPVEKDNEKGEDEKKKQKQMSNTREKRERRRVSKYSILQIIKDGTSETRMDSEIERLRSSKNTNLEIMPVEDSDFHDFDKDRRERSFRKGQVWAVYDEDDGMPRHYALISKVASVNPFEVTLSWLQFQSNGDEELISWVKMGFGVSCGKFTVSGDASVKYLNLFSHIADYERVAREVYVIYPKKGSVWALYNDNNPDAAGKKERTKDKRHYDIVVSLSSYSDIHGLSVAYLEKVDGFRTVYKRKAIGAHAVIWLGKDDMKLFSHQIPAKKLSGEEASGLPKDCWELDPASLTP